MFETNSELLTILGIKYINLDKVNIVGITNSREWIRIIELNREDMIIEGEIIKPFIIAKLYCKRHKLNERREDRLFITDEQRKIQRVDVLSRKQQLEFLDDNTDSSVKEIVNNFRSVGLIKPIVSKLEFFWNSYSCSYEARIVFKDSIGDKYTFLCKDPAWQHYWIDFVRREPTNINSHLLEMQWKLNDNNTFFVVGFTNRFDELPGPFDGRWPLIIGIHSLNLVL